MLEWVFPILDIILASLTSALLLSFRNAGEAKASAERMKALYGRLRIGLLLVVLGILISIGNTAFSGGRTEAERDLVRMATFPIYYVGVILIAASTWYPAPKGQRRFELEGGGLPSR